MDVLPAVPRCRSRSISAGSVDRSFRKCSGISVPAVQHPWDPTVQSVKTVPSVAHAGIR
ncbi:unnamed protein product, partial [marine sediment metagenome]